MSASIIETQIAALLSSLAYTDHTDLCDKLIEAGFSDVTHIGNGGTHAVICHREGETWCAVRGTSVDDLLDLVRNIRVWPVDSNVTGKVHRGFRQAADEREDEINEATLMAPGRLVFTGHSQGAAVAKIFAARVGEIRARLHGYSLPEYIGFGAPKVGNASFNAAFARYTSSAVEVTNSSDPIPWLPFFWPYRPIKSDRIHFLSSGEPVFNISRLAYFRDQFSGMFKILLRFGWNMLLLNRPSVAFANALRDVGHHYLLRYMVRLNDPAKAEA